MKNRKLLLPLLALLFVPSLSGCSETWKNLNKEDAERALTDAYYITYNSNFILEKEYRKADSLQSSYTYIHSSSNSSALTKSFSFENGVKSLEKKNLLEKKSTGYLISYDYFSEDSKKTIYYNDKIHSINDFFPSEIRKSNLSFLSLNGKKSSNGTYSLKLMRSDETILEFILKDFGISEIIGKKGSETEKYTFTYNQESVENFLDSEKENFDIRFFKDSNIVQEKQVIAGNKIEYTGDETAILGTPETPFSGWSEDTEVAYKNLDLVALYGNGYPDYTINFYTLVNNEYVLSTTQVKKRGSNLLLPTPSAVDGRKFVGWSKNETVNENDQLHTGVFTVTSSENFYARYETNVSQYLANFSWKAENLKGTFLFWCDKNKTLEEGGLYSIPNLDLPAGYHCNKAEVNNFVYSLNEIFKKRWTENDYGLSNTLNINLVISKESTTAKILTLCYNNEKISEFSVEPNSSIYSYLFDAEASIRQNYSKKTVAWTDTSGSLYKTSDAPKMPDENLKLNSVCTVGENSRTLTQYKKINPLDYSSSNGNSTQIKSSLFRNNSDSGNYLWFKADSDNNYKNNLVSFFGSSDLEAEARRINSKTFDYFYDVFPEQNERTSLSDNERIARNGTIYSLNKDSSEIKISLSEFYNTNHISLDTAFTMDDFITENENISFAKKLGSIVAINYDLYFDSTITVLSFGCSNTYSHFVISNSFLNLERSRIKLHWLDLEQSGSSSSALLKYKTSTETVLEGNALVRKALEINSNEYLSPSGSVSNYMSFGEKFIIRSSGASFQFAQNRQNPALSNFRLGSSSSYLTNARTNCSYSIQQDEGNTALMDNVAILANKTFSNLSYETYYAGNKLAFPQQTSSYYKVDYHPYGNGVFGNEISLTYKLYISKSDLNDYTAKGNRSLKAQTPSSQLFSIEMDPSSSDVSNYAFIENGNEINSLTSYSQVLYYFDKKTIGWSMN